MNIKTISYGRAKNLGSYQSERLDVTVEVDDDEDCSEVFEQIKAWITHRLYPEESAQDDVIPY